MRTILPATLKPGVTPDQLPKGDFQADTAGGVEAGARIRGHALILWDPASPDRKRDDVAVDHALPASDATSESRPVLDRRAGSGVFRQLVPDFGARIRSGQTFIIAGDRFGGGSAREAFPAAIKEAAHEAGRPLVVVTGHGLGETFRRSAVNIGVYAVQCPDAVLEARDGDEFSFDPLAREVRNETRGRAYPSVALTADEEEIAQSGGLLAVGRRELRQSVQSAPVLEWPDPDLARRLSITEQILWAHRVDKNVPVKPGTTLRLYADLLPASDGTAPMAIHAFNHITGGHTIVPRQAAIVSDRWVAPAGPSQAFPGGAGLDFAHQHGLADDAFSAAGDGILSVVLAERGLILPGMVIAGAGSHSQSYGAYGAVGFGAGSTTIGFGWSTGYVYFTAARQRRVTFTGTMPPWVSAMDVALELLRRWGPKRSEGMSVEFSDPNRQFSMEGRHTIATLMAESEALTSLFPPDEVTAAWLASRGVADLPYPALGSGPEAVFTVDEVFDVSAATPMIARPFSAAQAIPADELAFERVTFDTAFVGSCANGSYDDLLSAARVVRDARQLGMFTAVRPLVALPGSRRVAERMTQPDARLGGESVADVILGCGGRIRPSWCGPCFGVGPDALTRGQRAIASFSRNAPFRLGPGGEAYLASPATVAASALAGYMAPPSAIGLVWNAGPLKE